MPVLTGNNPRCHTTNCSLTLFSSYRYIVYLKYEDLTNKTSFSGNFKIEKPFLLVIIQNKSTPK